MKYFEDLHALSRGKHPRKHASFQVISFHNLKDIQAFPISHYAVWCHGYDHLHIKQILISQERSKIWKSCQLLVEIISRVLSNESVFYICVFRCIYTLTNFDLIKRYCSNFTQILMRQSRYKGYMKWKMWFEENLLVWKNFWSYKD